MTRIIPAYAGSTPSSLCHARIGLGSAPHTRGALSSSMLTVSTFRDHPRIRGEHAGVGASGSSRDHPRIRGEHDAALHAADAVVGIIPAYAGSTTRMPLTASRLCGIIPAYAGSTFRFDTSFCRAVGSSPHTRGALRPPPRRLPSRGDHPRIRGEHVPISLHSVDCGGIIPAYAGSTYTCSTACDRH